MCIAIVKPAGATLPADEVLERCFIHNPDGAGLAVPMDDSDKFVISKGYFNFDEYLEAVKEYTSTDEIAFLHFRYATHGYVDEGNCHPFPVTTSYEDMRKNQLERVDQVMMHNGVFQINNENEEVSDTMTFNKAMCGEGVDPFRATGRFLIDQVVTPCRVAYLRYHNGEPEWTKFGTWQKVDDVYYSNDAYKRPVAPKYSTTSKAWRAGYSWTSKGYVYEKDYLEPDQIEQVVFGSCPFDGEILNDLHVCPSCGNDYSKIMQWMDTAPVRELEIAGISKETIRYWFKYGKVGNNDIA